MIDAKELRIGNFVFDPFDNIVEVSEIRRDSLSLTNKNGGFFSSFRPIRLTPEILEACGFNEVGVWSRIAINAGMVGDEGISNLVLGRCASEDGLPYAAAIEQSSRQGFSIVEAAEILKERNDISEDSFVLKKKDFVCCAPIKYLHQLQNLYFALTKIELNYQPQPINT